MNFADFHLIRPWWLVALPIGIFLAWWLWQRSFGASNWQAVCDQQLLPHLLVQLGGARSGLPLTLLVIAWVLAVLALAGPSWERQVQPVFSNIQGRVIVLDVSRSMDAVDLKPSRLALARFKTADILRQPFDGQYALVVFAGDAFTVSPLTDDADTLLNLLPALDTNVVPVQGSRADLGLKMAGTLLQQTGIQHGEVILITDGVDEQTKASAAQLLSQTYRVNVLGVGSDTGGPIPMAKGGFFKDDAGNIVLAGLDRAALQQVAEAGGGEYVGLSSNDDDIKTLLARKITDSFDLQVKQTELTSELWVDRGPWLVLLLLPLAAVAFRRGWLMVLPLVVFSLPPSPAHAFAWDELWLRPDQRAARAFKQGDMETAANIEQQAGWQGSAHYRSENFPAAEQAFSKNDSADNHYNRGNALAKQGKLQEALEAYQTALNLNPDMEDASHNYEIIKRALENQPPQEQNQQSDNSESGRTDEKSSTNEDSQDSMSEQEASEESQTRPSSMSEQQRDKQAQDEGEFQASPQDNRSDETAPQSDQQEDLEEQAAQQGDGEAEQQLAQMETEDDTNTESDQALEQWLRRIPDDPGGLLRRKFKLQYQRRDHDVPPSEQQW